MSGRDANSPRPPSGARPGLSGRERIAALIPHQGEMCLWDGVVEWDAGSIRLRGGRHRDPANPLRSAGRLRAVHLRSEEHTSELQSLMRISYAVFRLKKKK